MVKPTTSSLRVAEFPTRRTKVIFSCVFFLCGFVKMLTHDNILAGAEDILENTNYSTGWISVMINLPYSLTVVFMQFTHHRVKNVYQVWFACLAIIMGSLGVGFLPSTTLKIAAVCFTGIGIACVDIAMMALTVRYPDVVVLSYVMGDSFGRLVTPIMYTVFTSYLCIKPSLVFTIISMSAIMFPLQDYFMSNHFSDVGKPIEYQMLQEQQPHDDESMEKDSLSEKEQFENTEDQEEGAKVQEIKSSSIFLNLCLFYKSFSRFYAGFLGLAFQTLYAQSFLSTLVFPNSPIKPREHYQYYLMILWSGSFAGLALGYISDYCGKTIQNLLSTNCRSYLHIVFSICNLTALFVAVWYRSIPNFWVVLVLCFITGMIAGTGYLISLTPVSKETEDIIVFARITAVAVKGAACVIAAIVAISLEPLIRQRCFEVTNTRQYCIARYIGIGQKPCYST